MHRALVLFLLALIMPACRTVEDYLADLETLDPTSETELDFERSAVLFDAGQLGHEALTGLALAEEMTFSQAMRALSHGCSFLGRARGNPLLQADGAVLIGHLASRIPVPSLDVRLEVHENNYPIAEQAFQALIEARAPLRIPSEILVLDSPDAVAANDAYRNLKEWTGQDHGRDPAAWEAWWETVRDDYVAEFVRDSREPLRVLGSIRWKNASEARGVLSLLTRWLSLYAHPDLRGEYIPAVLRVGRQAVVLQLIESIRVRHEGVREDVAAAMAKVLDPGFLEPILLQLGKEREGGAATRMIQTLRHYPSRATIARIIDAMALDDPRVSINAAATLAELTGRDFGENRERWLAWWDEEGTAVWP